MHIFPERDMGHEARVGRGSSSYDLQGCYYITYLHFLSEELQTHSKYFHYKLKNNMHIEFHNLFG